MGFSRFTLTIVALYNINHVVKGCGSRSVCRTPTVSFISMATLHDTEYKMVPHKNDRQVASVFECQRLCLQTGFCFHLTLSPSLFCYLGHIAKQNPFSKVKLKENMQGWITMRVKHLQCERNPCGNYGECVADYSTDAFTCKCDTGRYGKLCEYECVFKPGVPPVSTMISKKGVPFQEDCPGACLLDNYHVAAWNTVSVLCTCIEDPNPTITVINDNGFHCKLTKGGVAQQC